MPKLSVVSAIKVIKIAQKLGYNIVRQRGSHIVLRNAGGKRLVVPNHKRLKPGTLLQILRILGISKEKFVELLNR